MDSMKLLVGLGNPGKEYALTRHNAGALFVQFVAKKYGAAPWREEKKFFGLTTKVVINDENYFLLLPQTFMNLSGQAVQAVTHFYKLSPAEIIVAHDDLDISLGSFKISPKGPQAHNGLLDIDARLGGNEYTHVRLGIEGRGENRQISGMDYVLMSLNNAELEILNGVFANVAEELFK